MRKILPAPDSLVSDGKIRFGVFDAPVRNVNLLDAAMPGLIGPASGWWKRYRLKQWQFFQVVHPQYAFCFLIIDFAFTASSFFFVFDREKEKAFEHKRLKYNRKVALAENLYDGRCQFREKNYRIEIFNRLDEGHHDIEAEIGKSRKAPAVNVNIRVHQPKGEIQPLVVSLPVGKNRGMYSHKVVCPVSGTASFGDAEITLDPSRDVTILDEHKALYPHHTYWKWATFGFINPEGRTIGVNLTDNLIKDQRRWNENAVFTGDTITLLGPAHFEFDIRNTTKPWKIRDEEGRVELDFTPQNAKIDRVSLVFFNMDYRQPCGLFNGKLVDGKGETHNIENVFGITEYHNAYY
ncbi:MAG: DUF2804 domain-containing protein [bacterium]